MGDTQIKILAFCAFVILMLSYLPQILLVYRFIKERKSNLYNWSAHVDVLFDNQVVGTMSYFCHEEKGWVKFHLVPNADGFVFLFRNDLWENRRFVFRDPDTQLICDAGYEVKAPPRIKDQKVQLKNIHFSRKKDQ